MIVILVDNMATPTVNFLLGNYLLMHDHSESDLGAILDPRYLKLDQTTPQSVINGSPIFEGLQFDITPTTTNASEGLLRWNATDGTLDLGMSGGDVTQQIGQELFTKVRNEPGYQTITNGQVVYISGRTGVYPSVRLAQSNLETTSRVLGVATQDIASPGYGFITTMGYVRGIKTDYTGDGDWGTTWVTGDLLYLSKTVAGQLTNDEPDAPHHSDIIGSVGVISSNQGSILITLDRHKTLGELTDIDGTALTTSGQLLVWNQTAGYWDANYNIANYLKLDQTVAQTTVGTFTFPKVVVNQSFTDPIASQTVLDSNPTFTFTEDNSSKNYIAFRGQGKYSVATTKTLGGTQYGFFGGIQVVGTNAGTISSAIGCGSYNYVSENASGTVTLWRGFNSTIQGATNTLSITGYHGFYGTNPTGVNIVNNYGLYLENMTAGSSLNYSIYSAGGTMYHLGNVGIGVVPTHKLHISQSGAQTTATYGTYIVNTATSSTASIVKAGILVSSTGTWDGTNASNVGVYINTISGGTNNYGIYQVGTAEKNYITSLGIGYTAYTPAKTKLYVYGSMTDADNDYKYGIVSTLYSTPSASTSAGHAAFGAYYSTVATGTYNSYSLYGFRNDAHNSSEGTTTSQIAAFSTAGSTIAVGKTATSTTVIAGSFNFYPYLNGTFNVTTLKLLACDGAWNSTASYSGTINITSVYGLNIGPMATSGNATWNITNKYGIYIGAITGGSSVNYAIYSAGGGSYHAGSFNIGSGATLTAGRLFRAVETYTETSGVIRGGDYSLTLNPSGTSTTTSTGLYLQAVTTSGNAQVMTGASLYGADMNVYHQGTGTLGTAVAGNFALVNNNTGIVTTAYLLKGAVTNSGGGSYTNLYGLYLGDVSAGTSINSAITTNAGNIIFNEGGDASTDFRVESDTEANMFFLDADADTDGMLYLGGTAGFGVHKGGICFAEIYVADGSTAQAIATGATYTKLTGFATNGQANNCTADAANDKIVVTKAGKYLVNCSINASSGTNNVTFKFSIFLNGAELSNCHCHRKYSVAGDYGSSSITGIIDVTTANWEVDVRARHDDGGAVNFTPTYMNMNITYLGET